MKSSAKFPLVFVLSISFLFLCSFLFFNAQAQISLEKLNLEDRLIRIQTNQGSLIIDIQLLENTDACFTDCHAILKIHPYQDITLPSKANSEFDWKFLKEQPWMDGLVSHHFEILETIEYTVEIPEYGKTLVNSTCTKNETNTTYECEVEQTIQTGSHKETRYEQEYKPFEFWGQTLEADKDYTIKLVGKKRPQLGTNNVDWIPTIKGFELKEWEWWNTTWNKCRKITNSTALTPSINDPAFIRINNTGTPFADFMPNAQDIRFTNGTDCNADSGSELTYWNITSNTSDTSGDLTFLVKRSSATQETILMYYNASGVSDTSDIANIGLFGDDFDRNDNATVGNGWDEYDELGGTMSIVSKTLQMVDTSSSQNLHIEHEITGNTNNSATMVRWKGTDVTKRADFTRMHDAAHDDSPKQLTDVWFGGDTLRFEPGGSITQWNGIPKDNTYYITTVGIDYPNKYEDLYNNTAVKILNNALLFTNSTGEYLYFWMVTSTGDSGFTMTVDWVLVVNYTDNTFIDWSLGSEETPCPLDNAYINENTKFEPPNMFCNVNDGGSPGVLIINASDIILNCNGMTLNGTSVSGSGIYNDGFDNVTIKNCTVQNYNDGIRLYCSEPFAEGNNLYNNTLTSNSMGLRLENGAFKTVISDSNISDNKDYGIYIYNSIGEEIDFNNTIINSIMKSNENYDVYVNANAYTFFINTSYDTEYVLASNLTRQWYVKVNVTDKNETAIENAEASVYDNSESLEWTENTSADGLTIWNPTTQYINKSGTATYYSPHTIYASHPDYDSNSTTLDMTESKIIHLILRNWDITFNVTSGEDENIGIDGLEIICNYTQFNQSGDTSNPYGPYEFPPGTWSCEFKDPYYEYFNKTLTFTVNNDMTIDVTMSQAGKMTYEEHDWLEWLYNCWNSGNCIELLEQIGLETSEINQTTNKIWNQFKRTDQSIVTNEDFISRTVNSTNNITINYTINVPEKEGYSLIEGIQGYDDFLPIRVHYWFLDETNTSCYSQGNYSIALAEPYCQPLTVYTVGQINTPINFTVDLRPSLPAGNYTIVRDIEIDPNNVWIDYGHEIIGQIEVLEDGKEAMASIKGEGQIVEDYEPEEQIQQEELNKILETQPVEDKTTGMITVNQIDNLSYIAVIVSVITLILVGLIYKNSRKRTPWGY